MFNIIRAVIGGLGGGYGPAGQAGELMREQQVATRLRQQQPPPLPAQGTTQDMDARFHEQQRQRLMSAGLWYPGRTFYPDNISAQVERAKVQRGLDLFIRHRTAAAAPVRESNWQQLKALVSVEKRSVKKLTSTTRELTRARRESEISAQAYNSYMQSLDAENAQWRRTHPRDGMAYHAKQAILSTLKERVPASDVYTRPHDFSRLASRKVEKLQFAQDMGRSRAKITNDVTGTRAYLRNQSADVRQRLACLDLAEAMVQSSETCAKNGDLYLAADLLHGAKTVVQSVKNWHPDSESPGSALVAGFVEGLAHVEVSVEGHQRQRAIGKVFGSAVGMGADAAAILAGIGGEVGSGLAVVGTGGLAVAPAAGSAALSAGSISFGVLSGQAHWQSLQDALYEATNVPATGGRWSGEKGESKWHSSKPEVTDITQGVPVPFNNGYPDFSKWAKETVTLEKFQTRPIDSALADQALADKMNFKNKSEAKRYREKNKLTWHHKEDGKTMQLLPAGLHSKVPHQGGHSLGKNKK